MPGEAAIVVEQLTKVYRPGRAREVRAVDGVSFAVRRGEIFGLLGPNGAGKTTLLKMLTTLTAPTGGRAAVLGHDVVREALAVRRSIAVVLQQYAVELFLTVRENLITFGNFHGLSLKASRLRAEQVLAQFHLAGHAPEKAQDLSTGTRRRLQVAKMFMVDTPILFLDEPTTGMDPFVKRELLATIREQARSGRTILLTTQMLSEAEELCDRVLILDHGTIAAQGDLASLRSLSRGLYELVLSFESVGEELLERLRAASPARLEVKHRTVEMTVRSSESDVLALLSSLAERWPILHLEVSGATLEDI
ncbi:MAG TPA: ABC transporter ATP-binding protein, partial [Gemmatimonadales bacterium]|nr:ABC transporter ATP-binding protein [Gemmatimonadales bacterium]